MLKASLPSSIPFFCFGAFSVLSSFNLLPCFLSWLPSYLLNISSSVSKVLLINNKKVQKIFLHHWYRRGETSMVLGGSSSVALFLSDRRWTTIYIYYTVKCLSAQYTVLTRSGTGHSGQYSTVIQVL